MKKVVLMVSLLILGCYSITAQDDMRFGAKAGFNISSLGGDANLSYDPKAGFHVGGVLEIPFSDELMIQPEALISLQGSGGFFQDDLNFWYLNVPVMAKYNVWDELYVEAGPYLGLLLSNNVDRNISGTGASFDNTNGLDLGLGIGAGYRLDENFYFQIRYSTGFINVIEDVNSKNRVFAVSAVYFL
ncbi:porin family protein [Maribacter sp. PR1]|uniref:Porin family protein n=1 Tax=Maribacter cobaltidurans TaxID=1178778 RepID=A0ABU7IWK3_9FLAO|nr:MULTISPECIES: porin family protein [Maribacter]MDC6389989.1 porin family protein [Maribacter sp. PR1]MEE1977379.1 porin family protein [Maribacter cobaltidurans]